MNVVQQHTRRHFFRDCGIGLGKLALVSLMAETYRSAGQATANQVIAPEIGSIIPRAKRVIFLFMAGAPSQLDLFDYKPELVKLQGSPIPPSFTQGERYAFIQPDAAVLAPRFPFRQHGQCGAEISEVMPHLAEIIDDIAIVKSMQTDLFNHAPAQLLMNTGNGTPGRPSMGAWLSYGIGSLADDLPAFVVLKSGEDLSGGAAMWGAGVLPSSHQGVPFRGQGEPILHVTNPPGIDDRTQRQTLDLIQKLNHPQLQTYNDPEIATRIEAYETAFRMQTRAPELMDFAQESAATMELYGADANDPQRAFANNCLLARRLAERGVRFIELYHGGWDHHSQIESGLKKICKETDQATAALIKDLKGLGMLEDTLVIWGGEFGRTPMVEASAALGRSQGRDHHPKAFTMWLAGGGIRPGVTIGTTDELGFNVITNPVHVHDLQATILHCLGIDHEKLSVNVGGLDVRLTGVEPHHVVKQLLL